MTFFTKFIRPLFNKSVCYGNTVDDILTKVTANNDPEVNINSQKVSALWCQMFWHSGEKPPGGGGWIPHPTPSRVKKKHYIVTPTHTVVPANEACSYGYLSFLI